MPSCIDGPPSIWDTHGLSGNVFADPTAFSSAIHPPESNPWISNVSEHTSPHVMSGSQTPALDSRCQSGPSAENSFDSKEGRFSKNFGADQQRLQIPDLHSDKFLTQQHLLVGRQDSRLRYVLVHNFIRKLPYGSRSVKGTHGPDFELLDAKIATALHWISPRIPSSRRRSTSRSRKLHEEDRSS